MGKKLCTRGFFPTQVRFRVPSSLIGSRRQLVGVAIPVLDDEVVHPVGQLVPLENFKKTGLNGETSV